MYFSPQQIDDLERAVKLSAACPGRSADVQRQMKYAQQFMLPALSALRTENFDDVHSALDQALKAVAMLAIWVPQNDQAIVTQMLEKRMSDLKEMMQ